VNLYYDGSRCGNPFSIAPTQKHLQTPISDSFKRAEPIRRTPYTEVLNVRWDNFTPHYTTPLNYFYTTSTLYYTILHYTILHYNTLPLHYTILYYTTSTLYYIILHYTILYYTILYYTILYYTILYYTIIPLR